MKTLLLAFAMFAAQDARATPYFRVEPLNDAKTVAVVPLAGNTDGVAFGMETAVLRHHAEDGYLLLPGVSWDLLDVGASKGTHWRAELGPSIDLSEPVKAYLARGLDLIPGAADKFKALRWLAEESLPGEKRWQLKIGPAFQLDPGDFQHLRDFKGALVWHVGGAVRF